MKKYIYSIIILLGGSPLVPVLAQGIEFNHGSWADVQATAKTQNKLIFIDFYTDWCAPCKYMTMNIFPQKEAGDFYNANFISYKVNAEKGEGPALAKQYKVAGYPTLAYLNYKGEVVHRLTSSMDVKELIEHGKMALTPQDDYEKLKAGFLKNELDKDDLYRYLVIVKTKGDNREADKVFERYFDKVAKIDGETFDLITNNAGSTRSNAFQYLEQHRNDFAAVVGKEKIDGYIRNEYLQEFQLDVWRKTYPEVGAYQAAKKLLQSKIALTEKEELNFDSNYYLAMGDEENYMSASKKLVEKYYYNDDFQISNVLGGSSRLITANKNILIAKGWAEHALSLKDNSLNNATLALIYKKLKDKTMALKYINLSLEASKRDKDGYDERIGSFKQEILAMP